MKNNPIFQVLVVSNTGICTTGYGLDQLAVGQLGLFDADTNLAIDPNGAFPDKVYWAVGIPNAGGTLGDIRKSAGEYIRKSKINTVFSQQSVDEAAQVTTINFAGFVPVKDKDYVFRFNFMNNDSMYMHGFDHPTKSFVVSTDPNTAPNLADFCTAVAAEFNKDTEQVIVAVATSTTVVLTFGIDEKVDSLGGLNPKYRSLRPYKVKVSVGGDFIPSNYTITTVEPVYAQGLGYDIAQLEYLAGGWNGNPGIYRDSTLTGLIGHSTKIFADITAKYWTMRLNYEFESHSGGNLPYSNQLETLIAIPETGGYSTIIALLVDSINAHNPASGGVAVPTTSTTTTTAAVTTTTTTAPVTTTTTTVG